MEQRGGVFVVVVVVLMVAPLDMQGFLQWLSGKESACNETQIRSPGWEDALEEGMATHSSILDWRIPWAEEPGGLQSTGLQRVGHH